MSRELIPIRGGTCGGIPCRVAPARDSKADLASSSRSESVGVRRTSVRIYEAQSGSPWTRVQFVITRVICARDGGPAAGQQAASFRVAVSRARQRAMKGVSLFIGSADRAEPWAACTWRTQRTRSQERRVLDESSAKYHSPLTQVRLRELAVHASGTARCIASRSDRSVPLSHSLFRHQAGGSIVQTTSSSIRPSDTIGNSNDTAITRSRFYLVGTLIAST